MTNAPAGGVLYSDMEGWQRWQRRQMPVLRRLRDCVEPRRRAEPELTITRWGAGDSPVVLVALDSGSPSQIPALLDPARHLLELEIPLAVLAPFAAAQAAAEVLPKATGSSSRVGLDGSFNMPLSAVLSAGDHLPAGRLALGLAREQSRPYIVVQHGILTPFAPPLPPDAHLLAWNEADTRFWTAGTRIRTEVVGSQLLWRAAQRSHSPDGGTLADKAVGVTFLGQLHGAELPREITRRSVARLSTESPVIYRPHPGEQDIASRVQHRIWGRRGVVVATQGLLDDSPGAILSHFSTGILESAALGLPAYAYCADPPTWLRQLWSRYEMAQWGEVEATRVTTQGQEPAAAVAAYVEGIIS